MTPDLLAGRPNRGSGWATAALACAELVLIGWTVTTRAALLFAVGQALLLAVLALGLLMLRYTRFRRSFERALVESAAERERARLAEELHDVLGHELSLVALRAGALQVSTTGETSTRAAALRAQVEQVVLELRQTVELLRAGELTEAAPLHVEHDVDALACRAREAGALVEVDGRLRSSTSAPVRLTVFQVVREGLTNALKHSPGSSVQIRQWHDGDNTHVQVETDGGADEDPETWSGLAALTARLEALGGSLRTTATAGRRTLHAAVPHQLVRPASPGPRSAPRRPAASTVRWAAPPLVAVAAIAMAFYTWSSHDATLEQPQFDAIAVGQTLDAVRSDLPPRQAAVRLTRLPPVPEGWRCAYYTDGNFPLGMAAFEVCDDGVRITRTTDLRTVPLR